MGLLTITERTKYAGFDLHEMQFMPVSFYNLVFGLTLPYIKIIAVIVVMSALAET